MHITEEEEAHLTMYIRMIKVFRKHEYVLDENPEFKKQALHFKDLIDQLFAELTDEERDRILDRYKEDMIYLNGLKDVKN